MQKIDSVCVRYAVIMQINNNHYLYKNKIDKNIKNLFI